MPCLIIDAGEITGKFGEEASKQEGREKIDRIGREKKGKSKGKNVSIVSQISPLGIYAYQLQLLPTSIHDVLHTEIELAAHDYSVGLSSQLIKEVERYRVDLVIDIQTCKFLLACTDWSNRQRPDNLARKACSRR